MWWWRVNIIVLVIGIISLLYGEHIDKDENLNALSFAIIGMTMVMIAVISIIFHLVWDVI